MKTYTVQPGDTLYGIAKQFGTSVDDIKKLNNLSSNTISIGQVLKIQEDTSPLTYTVQKGDTLYSISKKFDIPVLDIMQINNITSTVLQIGQVLKLFTQEEDGIIVMPVYENYKVEKGDSLYSIARKFNTTVDEIKKDNNLTSNLLSIGQVLKIKVGEEIFGVEECFGEGYSDLEKTYINYTVKKGDTLYSIARNYNTTVDSIMQLNNLKTSSLSIGQVLKIKEVS